MPLSASASCLLALTHTCGPHTVGDKMLGLYKNPDFVVSEMQCTNMRQMDEVLNKGGAQAPHEATHTPALGDLCTWTKKTLTVQHGSLTRDVVVIYRDMAEVARTALQNYPDPDKLTFKAEKTFGPDGASCTTYACAVLSVFLFPLPSTIVQYCSS
jgi:hypothetical protein